MWNASLIEQGNFIDVFLAQHVSGANVHHQEHLDAVLQRIVFCTVLDGDVHSTIRTVHTTYATSLKTTTHPKTLCRKPYAATLHLMLLIIGVCTRNMSS